MRPTSGSAIRLTAGLLALLLAPAVRVALAQLPSGSTRCSARATRDALAWTPPLDRQVVLYAHDVSLRDALDRLGAASGIRFAYSAEFLPLDRRVCVSSARMSVGDALTALLDSTNVEPFVVTPTQIVLAPSRQKETSAPVTARGVGVLERVVVTGSVDGTSERPLTVALDVVSAPQIRATDGSLAQMLGATVPGMWLWGQSPSALLAHYGSVRGASSFGLSYPKVYIDGIEVANPLLITQLDPAILERVEVIRGPQGAALYGADAISGVINIITRHDGTDPSGEAFQLTSSGGLLNSSFAARPVFQQEHGVTVRSGSNVKSVDLSIAGSTMGDYIPNFSSNELRGGGALRLIGARTSLSATARLYSKSANVSANPLLTTTQTQQPSPDTAKGKPSGDFRNPHMESVFARPVIDSSPQSVREYTLGVTGQFLQSDRWTHTLSMGVDGYRLSNIPNDFTPIPSAADSALRAARGAADRGTFRASSVGQFSAPSATLKVTFAAEQSTLNERTAADQAPPGAPAARDVVAWSNNVGLVTQVDAGFRNTLFATAGLRGERNGGAGGVTTSLLPMLGSAWVIDRGSLTMKLRSAYGRASRPPRTAARQTTWLGVRTSAAESLKPEEQTGIEVGTDVLIGGMVGVHVTRFDQHAFGLIQPVAVVIDASPQGPPVHRLAYALENVGEIDNSGWEMQSSVGLGQWSIGGTLSFVDSRVRRLATGYRGDLRAGDRMLGVPARTGALTASWTAASWSANVAFTRASDWINYDRLALANSASDPTHRAEDLVGPTLRAYWREYAGVSRLNAAASRDVFRRVALTLSGSNLLNEQLGDPDNVTVLPGRAFLVGLRARF